jgi:hypothetical protein
MKHFATIVALAASLVVASASLVASATAANSVPPVSNKRLLISCMTKQMAASRTISYNEATKVCKELIKSQRDEVIASNDSKSGRAR